MKALVVLASTIIVLLVATSCGDDDADRQSETGELTVFAAASLTDAFNDIQRAFEDEHPGVAVTFNFGGSQQLVTQLVQGARADVFASANQAQMHDAREEGVIDGEPQIFTRNRLAVIVPADNPAGIATSRDLAQPGVKLVIANEAVPVGRYTLEVLDTLSADPAYGSDFRSEVEANIVSLEDNVRQVVSKIALGEADAGVVYVTDVTSDVEQDVTLIPIQDPFNVIAEYPIARVEGGNAGLADAFIDFVLSDAGQQILMDHGFAELP